MSQLIYTQIVHRDHQFYKEFEKCFTHMMHNEHIFYQDFALIHCTVFTKRPHSLPKFKVYSSRDITYCTKIYNPKGVTLILCKEHIFYRKNIVRRLNT